MLRLADRGSNDFRLDLVETEYIGNRPDQFYAVPADIIDTSYKGADIRRPCTGCQQCLPCRENQSHIRTDPHVRQGTHRFHAFSRHGNFHDHMGIKSGENLSLSNHLFRCFRKDFR